MTARRTKHALSILSITLLALAFLAGKYKSGLLHDWPWSALPRGVWTVRGEIVDLGILGFFFTSFLWFLAWSVDRGKRRAKSGDSAAGQTLTVRYCAPACHELSDKTLMIAYLMNQSGPCTFCVTPVTYGRGHTTSMFPYRNQKAFLCSGCLPKGREFMEEVRECCLCGKAL